MYTAILGIDVVLLDDLITQDLSVGRDDGAARVVCGRFDPENPERSVARSMEGCMFGSKCAAGR